MGEVPERKRDAEGLQAGEWAGGANGLGAGEVNEWEETLRALEGSVVEVTQALNRLCDTLGKLTPGLHSVTGPGMTAHNANEQEARRLGVEEGVSRVDEPVAMAAAGGGSPSGAEGWQSPQGAAAPPEESATEGSDVRRAGRGLELLPRTYTITVENRPEEDRRVKVDLAPLHRALIGIEGVRDVSLVGYMHGVATVSVESEVDIETSALEAAVSEAMQRQCSVVARDGQRLLVRIVA